MVDHFVLVKYLARPSLSLASFFMLSLLRINLNKICDNMEQEVKDKIEKGLIESDGTPVMCKCGNDTYKDIAVDFIDNIIMEQQRICLECNEIMGVWVTGNWEM